MPTAEKKLARLVGRTSREGWLQLQRMRHHPNFAALLAHLEEIEGEIFDWHVEAAARGFLDAHDNELK